MIYAEAALLTCLLFTGIFCVRQDFSFGIVPNKYLLIGSGIAMGCHILLLFTGKASYYPAYLLDMAIADLLAFLLFLSGLWAAGDAKLFMFMYLCLPPRLFDRGILALSITPYLFVFLTALLWVIADTVVRLIRKEDRKRLSFDWKNWVMSCVTVVAEATAFSRLVYWVLPEFVSGQPLFNAVLMMIYAYFCSNVTIMRRWYALAAHVLVLILVIIFNGRQFVLPDWKNYLILLLVIGFQRVAALYNYQKIRTSEIKAGMIPSAETVLLFSASRVQSLPANPSEEMSARISTEEAEAVKRWENSFRGRHEIWIVRKIPFALYILIGFAIWIAVRLTGVV